MTLTASANACSNARGSAGVVGHEQAGLAVDDDLGDPADGADATTAVSQAIASRLTMPRGS